MTLNGNLKMKRAYKKHECTLGCEKPCCIKRQRDELSKENSLANEKLSIYSGIIDSLQVQITELLAVRDALERQLEQRNKTSRNWVLRKLGL
jgi:hypothetical protein